MTRTRLLIPGSDGTIGGPGGSPAAPGVVTYDRNVPTLQRLTIAQPAAGADWSYTVPAGTWLKLNGGMATFTTSAVVATRYLGHLVKDGAGVVVGQYYQDSPGMPASQTAAKIGYERGDAWTQAGNLGQALTGSVISLPSIVLQPGWSYGSLTANLDAGDQYSTIQLWWQTWTTQPIYEIPGPNL